MTKVTTIRAVNPFQSFDPRRSLAARIGWMFLLLSTSCALAAGLLAGTTWRTAAESDIGALYASRASHIVHAIDWNIDATAAAMQLAATVMGASTALQDPDARRQLVDAIRKGLPEAAWVGVAGSDGTILAGSPDGLEEENLAEHSWFALALQHPVSAGPQPGTIIRKLSGPPTADASRGYLVIAAPITGGPHDIKGVAVAYFRFDWIDRIVQDADAKSQQSRPAQVLLLGPAGQSLYPLQPVSSPQVLEPLLAIANHASEGNDTELKGYVASNADLIGYAMTRHPAGASTAGWTIVVRESLATAFAPANRAVEKIVAIMLLIGIGLSIFAFLGTHLLLRRLARIAESSDTARLNGLDRFPEVDGQDEVARIARSFGALFDNVRSSNRQLQELNRTLERKVDERTREVSRLSEEARNAAISQERLRLSRDLHDTLAHTMIAILTQIRLIRKLHRIKPELVGPELEQAEIVAVDGLAKARDAVTRLRYVPVQNETLGQVLRRLATGLQDKTGIDVSLDLDEGASRIGGSLIGPVYRIVEEAFRNVEQHAGARRVAVAAALTDSASGLQALELGIEDDGSGFDTDSPKPDHFGLLGMHEQATALGGSLNFISGSGKGTQIKLHVPV